MRKLLLIHLLLLSSCLLNPHDLEEFDNYYFDSVDLTDNLVFYHFNDSSYPGTTGDVQDASGQNNNSDSYQTPTKAQGIYGDGIYCNGTNGVDLTPSVFDAAFSGRTISLWFRADNPGGVQYIYEEGGGVNGIVIYLDDNVLYAGVYKNTGGDYDIYLPYEIQTNTWYNVGIRFDTNDGFRFYINGELVGGPANLGLDMPSHTDENGICFQNDDSRRHTGGATAGSGPMNFFIGVIDELAVWNRTLSEAELLNVYRRQGRI